MLKKILYKFITYYISKIIFFFIQFFIKRTSLKKINHIVILCTGESLLKFKQYIKKKNDIDLILIVNFESRDIKQSGLSKIFKKYPITTLYNITESIMSLRSAMGLTFYENYIQRFDPDIFPNKKKYKSAIFSKRLNFRYNSITNRVKYLPKKIFRFKEMIRKKNKNVSFNCGLIGILLACYYSPKRITIFGMDFYANKYFNSKEKYMEKKEMLKVIILKDKFFNCFKTIVSLFKNINFEICTYYKNELNKKNLVKIL